MQSRARLSRGGCDEPLVDVSDVSWEDPVGLERAYDDESLWSYVLAEDTPDYLVTGSLTWRYDGQQTYTDAPTPYCGPQPTEVPYEVLTGIEFDALAYLSVVEIDRYGRRWVVDAVDEVAAEEELAAAGVIVGEDLGEDGIAGLELELDEGGEPMEVEPTGWSFGGCGGSFFYESLSTLTELPTATAEVGASSKVVQVTAGGELCSGALIREDAVLTAAHCIVDATGLPVPLGNIKVCGGENLAVNGFGGCWDLDGMSIPANFFGGFAVQHDWAVLWLDRSVSLGREPAALPLTSSTNAAIQAARDNLDGYLLWDDGAPCATNLIDDDCLTIDDGYTGRDLWKAGGTVHSTPGGSYGTSPPSALG